MFEISKCIELDCGHRVPLHESKCRNLHGHRYTVEMTISGPLVEAGAESGMVKDFGFIKSILMSNVSAPFDHSLILQFSDPLVKTLIDDISELEVINREISDDPTSTWSIISIQGHEGIKINLIGRSPTAENLARLWGGICNKNLPGGVVLAAFTVWETPTSMAIYRLG